MTPVDALTTEENKVNLALKNALINEDEIMDRFLICALTIGFAGYINDIKATISEMETTISEMKTQISALETYPEGYTEPLSWHPATDPAGPDEQPTIEQPEIIHQTTNTVELQERMEDPYIQAMNGGVCEK